MVMQMKKGKKKGKASQNEHAKSKVSQEQVSKEEISRLNEKLSAGETLDDTEMDVFYQSQKTVKDLTAMHGVNPNPLDYMVVYDNGQPIYTMCFTIDKLPRKSEFLVTYAPLFNFAGITSVVFISPKTDGKASRELDKRIVTLDSEHNIALDDNDRNRARKINAKLKDTERYAEDVESGDNSLYEVQFLHILQSLTVDGLRLLASDFHSVAREKGIEVSACYSVHPEAFLSGYPINRVVVSKSGLLSSTCIKTHVYDKASLCDIFNHTRSGFSHRDGVFMGHNMYTHQPHFYDPYDKSHDGFGAIFAGTTGTGKSASIKMLSSRLVDFSDVKIRSIDFEKRGARGEYGLQALKYGGVSYQIKPKSDVILNLFEIGEEYEYDELTQKEYEVLNLAANRLNKLNILMTIIKNGREMNDFAEEVFVKAILLDCITELYDECGIVDGDVDSLYMASSTIEGGRLSSGRKRKPLPTISQLYKKVLLKRRNNTNVFYRKAYEVIIAELKQSVRELYYCPHCMRFFSRQEYESLNRDENGQRICPEHNGDSSKTVIKVVGTKSYFDGQSTVSADVDTTHINIDLSQLSEKDRIEALPIAMDYMQERHIKRNSANPKKARKMIFIVDELHKVFPYPEARQNVADVYRTARKQNVSPWSATQALADYGTYAETLAIVKNTASIFLFKQSVEDKNYLREHTILTDSQIDKVCELGGDLSEDGETEYYANLSHLDKYKDSQKTEEKNARKGEVCLIDNQTRVAFIKVDYLMASEAYFVETDMAKIQQLYEQGVI